jgi:hypothetical protein
LFPGASAFAFINQAWNDTASEKKVLMTKKWGAKNRQPVQALSESASPASLCIFLSFYFFVALFLRVRPDQE